MWVKAVSRQELLEIFQREGRSVAAAIQGELLLDSHAQELQLIWRDDPEERPSLPVAVVVEARERRDFLAWVATYLRGFRPFTAHCRVIDASFAAKYLQREREVSLGRLENACLGVILGEAATEGYGQSDLRSPSLAVCMGTYSYAMSRALALGMLPREAQLVTEGWTSVRRIARYGRGPLDISALKEVWSVILGLSAGDDQRGYVEFPAAPTAIFEACRDLYETGEMQAPRWTALVGDVPELRSVPAEMRGAREERVVAFEKALGVLGNQGWSRPHAGFLCGFLASEIAPGSIDHLRLLSPWVRRFGSVSVWYGLCAGLRTDSDVRDHSSGLGRSILRDILWSESAVDRPRCDIAVSELEVLSGAVDHLLEFRTRNQGQLEVELIPCLNIWLRWLPRSDSMEDFTRPSAEMEEKRRLFEELGLTLQKFSSLYARLGRILGIQGTSGEQGRRGRR